MGFVYEDKKNCTSCTAHMDVEKEDRKRHDDGIFGQYMGYREWFHYVGTFFVKGKPLTFMLGFVPSCYGIGVIGWISFEKKQYSLGGNIKDVDHDGYFELETKADFLPGKKGYTISYTAERDPRRVYDGKVAGKFPEYTIEVKTKLNEIVVVDIKVKMKINSPNSLHAKRVPPWIPFQGWAANWFHSGDITASITGTVAGKDVTSTSSKNRGWYERQWAHVPVPWPSTWMHLIAHLDKGGALDMFIAETLGMRVPSLSECWLHKEGIFYEFPDYKAHFPKSLESIKREYSNTIGESIICEGKNGEDSFRLEATVTDFRLYEYSNCGVKVKWTSFFFDTDGAAVLGGQHIDMKGRGVTERCPIQYWL